MVLLAGRRDAAEQGGGGGCGVGVKFSVKGFRRRQGSIRAGAHASGRGLASQTPQQHLPLELRPPNQKQARDSGCRQHFRI
jgi:hypothetical protein